MTLAKVVGIAAGVGGGKSTLAKALAERLGEAGLVQFDHYERMTEQPVEAVRRWMREGADPDALVIPGLAEDLQSLKSKHKFVVFETPFGRRHSATGRHIDFLVWIDTPLDIALARKIRQFAAGAAASGEAASFGPWLQAYLGNYVEFVGDLLRAQRDTVRAQADLVVDGRRSPEELAREVERAALA